MNVTDARHGEAFRWRAALCALLLVLAGCSRALHFRIHFDDTGGLAIGDPVTFDGQTVGEVTALADGDAGGRLVSVTIAAKSVGAIGRASCRERV